LSKAPHTPGAVKQPAFLRPYTAVRDELKAQAAAHPDLVTLTDIGDSGEKVRGVADRDIWVAKVTSPVGGGKPKPAAVYIAGVHPTETGNPELMMKLLRELTDGYGKRADITALLDSREVHIIPMANPDGHAVVEEGYRTGNKDMMVKRKSTSPPRGVDLNRNWDWHWGQGAGSSSNPGSGKYRGPAPFSEPEPKAIADYVAKVRPGLFIDWHSPGKDVLYPWGDTKDPPPDAFGMASIAAGFTRRNGYEYEQASKYSTSQGTSDDYVYGRLGIPAMTVETATTSRIHDDQFRGAWRDNKDVMTWGINIADDAFVRGAAPDVTKVSVGNVRGTVSARVQAPAAVDGSGTAAITAVEAFTDPTTAPGAGTPMRAADGAFDSPTERALSTTRELQPAEGARLIYVRARDAAGRWGAPAAQWLPGASN
jgi:hypothetical protein